TRRSPESLSGIAGFLEDHIRRWDHLEVTIRAGRPPFTAYDDYARHPDRWQPFHDGMRAIASFTVDEVARKARLPGGPLRLIDVGGSHGLYTIALCRRYPSLSAVIYDWPEGVVAARREIAQAGLAAQISTQTGDFLTDELGGGIYPYTQVRAWLLETGYRDVRVRRLLRAPGNVLIQAAAGSGG